jgi:hypothetical protein
MVYTLFFGLEEPVYSATPTLPAPVPTPEPAAEPDGPASVAGQLIDKAQGAVAAHDELVDATDEVTADEGPAVDEEAVPQVVIEAPAPAAVAGGVEPSAAFRDWVSNAVISGVAETDNPRAFINGVLVKRGDVVDHSLGISFDSVDAHNNLLLFKDATGAIVAKRY